MKSKWSSATRRPNALGYSCEDFMYLPPLLDLSCFLFQRGLGMWNKPNVCHKICSKTQLRLGHHFFASGLVYSDFHHFFTTRCSLCFERCPTFPRDRFIEVTSPRPQLGRNRVFKKNNLNQTQPSLSREKSSLFDIVAHYIYVYIYVYIYTHVHTRNLP